MNDISKKRRDGLDIGPASIKALLDAPVILPGESEVDYANLVAALTADLAPKTVFEQIVVADIIALEWDRFRYRRLKAMRLMHKARELLLGLLRNEELVPISTASPSLEEKEIGFARAALGEGTDEENGTTREEALRILDVTYDTSLDEVLAEAHNLISDEIDVYDRRLTTMERRRRQLLDDLNRLRSDRATVIEDFDFESV